jgi:hypothetical protein
VNIRGNQNLFGAFDFRDSGALIFRGAPPDGDDDEIEFDLSYFPDQTTEISLTSFEWNQKPIRPRQLQNLIELNLEETNINGTLGEYLSAPNLRHLSLSIMTFKEPESTKAQTRNLTRVFSDTKFLQGTPALETIKFEYGVIDENFVEALKSCTLLKSLTLHCNISRFVSPFLECLEGKQLVPSLGTLSISKSCLADTGMTFEEFRQRFMAKRPNVRFSEYY